MEEKLFKSSPFIITSFSTSTKLMSFIVVIIIILIIIIETNKAVKLA